MGSGRRIRDMVKEIKYMQMKADMRENGQMIKNMDKVIFKYKE